MMGLQVGFCFGTTLRNNMTQDRLWQLVQLIEDSGYDSLWFYNNNGKDMPAVLDILAETACRTSTITIGPHVLVAPGLELLSLAQKLSRIHRISNGRFVAALGLGGEREALIKNHARAATMLEALIEGLRSRRTTNMDCFVEETSPPYPIWLGGNTMRTVKRVATMADGWVPSFVTPVEFGRLAHILSESAARSGRELEPTFSVQVVYAPPSIEDQALHAQLAEEIGRHKPHVDVLQVYAMGGYDAVRQRVEEYRRNGAEHIILVPARAPKNWEDEIAQLNTEVVRQVRGGPALHQEPE